MTSISIIFLSTERERFIYTTEEKKFYFFSVSISFLNFIVNRSNSVNKRNGAVSCSVASRKSNSFQNSIDRFGILHMQSINLTIAQLFHRVRCVVCVIIGNCKKWWSDWRASWRAIIIRANQKKTTGKMLVLCEFASTLIS